MTAFKKSLYAYLGYGFPFVIICGIWQSLTPQGDIAQNSSLAVRGIWAVLSWNLLMWFCALAIFFLMLILHPGFRSQFISTISNIKDRDEREAQITGDAAKSSYMITLAGMIFLLFLSTFTLSLSPIPAEDRHDGKTQKLSISMRFRLYDQSEGKQELDASEGFRTSDFAPSASACLMALIAIQLVSFRTRVKRDIDFS